MALIASRYARALVDVVIDLKLDTNKIREEIRATVELVSSSAELRHVWESPAITQQQKLSLLDAIAGRAGLTGTVRNFLAVLMDHRRIAALPQIARQFEIELSQRLGLQEADVTSVRELKPEEKAALELEIQKLTGKKVRARYGTDPAVLGGAVVKIGSTIYDGSVRGQLLRIREQLSTA
jgi:F-type H+-transporting ATPase subunit delta